MNLSFSPADTFNRVLDSWRWVFLFILLGGLAGWTFHTLRPPVYESTASISFNIDYTHSGQLTDVEEDQILGVAGDVISSPQVLQKVVEGSRGLSGQGMPIDLPTLQQSVFAERKAYVYVLRVRRPSPQQAQALAGLWAQAAYTSLGDDRSHAQQAAMLQRYLDGLVSCLEQSVNAPPAQSLCSPDFSALQNNIKEGGSRLQAEKLAAQGISLALEFTRPEPTGTPARLAQYGRNQMVLAAALIGFVLGVWGVSLGVPARITWWLRGRRAG